MTRRARPVKMGRLACLLAVVAGCAERPALIPEDFDYFEAPREASREGRTIRLSPSGATFMIPQEWLEWHAEFQDNLLFTREELEKIRYGSGEWDVEYAVIANTLLPFHACAAHVGSESPYSGVQLRVYTTAIPPDRIRKDALQSGLKIAYGLDDSIGKKEAKAETGRWKEWSRTSLRCFLYYEDYGDLARIDLFTQQFGVETVVFLFMYRGDDAQIEDAEAWIPEILQSFRRNPDRRGSGGRTPVPYGSWASRGPPGMPTPD